MKRFFWKKKQRKLGDWQYRIIRVFRPDDVSYEFVLQRREAYTMFYGQWEQTARTLQYTVAEEWSDELGLVLNDQVDRIRKPLI